MLQCSCCALALIVALVGCDGPEPRLPADSGRPVDGGLDAGPIVADAEAGPRGIRSDAGAVALDPGPGLDAGPSPDAGTIEVGCTERARHSLPSIYPDGTSILGVRLSHDGARIALRVHRITDAALIVAPIDGGAADERIVGLSDNPGLAWSPDDSSVYFNGAGIRRIAASGRAAPETIVSDIGASELDVSPDGRYAIFESFDLYRYDTSLGAGTPTMVQTLIAAPPSPPARPIQHARYSPDGSQIAFLQDVGASDPRSEAAELHIFDVGDGVIVRTSQTRPVRTFASAAAIAWPAPETTYLTGEIGHRERLYHMDLGAHPAALTLVYSSPGDAEIAAFDALPSGLLVIAESDPRTGASAIVVLECATP